MNILYVAALKCEVSQEFDSENLLITGIGEINATYQLTRHLQQYHYALPDIIINIGTAGSKNYKQGTIVNPTIFEHRDLNNKDIGLESKKLLGTCFKLFPATICHSGNTFINQDTICDIVDMEAYSLAFVAEKYKIPFGCIKYITDNTSESALEQWSINTQLAPKALISAVREIKWQNE